jgi:hypothetical protein
MSTATPESARSVLSYLDAPIPGAEVVSGFKGKLIEAMCQADMTNLGLLALGFPELAQAVYLYKFESDGVDQLRALAAYQPPEDLGDPDARP